MGRVKLLGGGDAVECRAAATARFPANGSIFGRALHDYGDTGKAAWPTMDGYGVVLQIDIAGKAQ